MVRLERDDIDRKAVLGEDIRSRQVTEQMLIANRFQHGLVEAAAKDNFRQAGFYQSVLKTIRDQHLLGYLAGMNVLPKYGFPVDVVPLKTNHLQSGDARRVELDRDLRIAVSEFAPGSGVVAGKRLWISEGLRMLPNKGLPERDYRVCEGCRWFTRDEGPACPQCGTPWRKRGTYVEPRFGFVAGTPDARGLGDERPQRLFASRIYFAERNTADVPPWQDIAAPAPLRGRFSRNGQLAVVNDGKGSGFRFCQQCGYARLGPPAGRRGAPATTSGHRDPLTTRPCGNRKLEKRDIAHVFGTDMAEFLLPRAPGGANVLWSVQAAIVEGAARALEIRRGEIEGTFYFSGSDPVFLVYDNVPGGAGLAQRIHGAAVRVLSAAHAVASGCVCGEGSSCYRCLRNYSNQWLHESLDRSAAASYLASFAV